METIVERNNVAVDLIRRRDFAPTVQILSETLRLFQDQLAVNPSSFSVSSLQEASGSMNNCLDEGILLPHVDESRVDEFFTGKDLFIYDQGIVIPQGLTDASTMLAILIFNAALSHHLCANQYPENYSQYLLQARSLYATAYQMQATTSQNNVLFRVAAINNAAAIEWEFGNDICCRKLNDCLMSIWAISVDQEHSSRVLYMCNFLWNILRKDDTAGAA